MANTIEKEDYLDYEPEDVSNDSPTGAEDTELEFSNLKLVEDEASSVETGQEANPDHPCMEGAHALPTTPGTSPQKNVLDPHPDSSPSSFLATPQIFPWTHWTHIFSVV